MAVVSDGETRQARELFERLAARFLADPAVTEGTGFGAAPGLRVAGKIFAMLGREGELIVKLPKDRVDQLVAAGDGARFDPRKDGRVMNEWVTVPVRHGPAWQDLADEALGFVGSAAGRRGRRDPRERSR
jgi:YjbR